jgi:hypothetical protein
MKLCGYGGFQSSLHGDFLLCAMGVKGGEDHRKRVVHEPLVVPEGGEGTTAYRD